MPKLVFFHAGTEKCRTAFAPLEVALNSRRYAIKTMDVTRHPEHLREAKELGVQALPALLVDETLFHINFGVPLADIPPRSDSSSPPESIDALQRPWTDEVGEMLVQFFHAGCGVCKRAEQVVEALDPVRVIVQEEDLLKTPTRANEARTLGIHSVPALVFTAGPKRVVWHIDYGASLDDLACWWDWRQPTKSGP